MSKKSKAPLPPGPVMVDVAGTTLTKEEKRRLRHPRVGGVILFTRNFESRKQLFALPRKIHRARDAPLLIAIDHEGGRVHRLRDDAFPPLPATPPLGHASYRHPLHALPPA